MTKRQTIEISLLSNDTFREIFQSSAEGIIMVDMNGRIVLANPVAERLFGYNEGEFINLQLEDLLPKRFQGKHVALRENFNEHPEPRRMGVGRDLMAMRKDGSEFPVEVSLSHKEISGQMLITAFVIDITERKRSEEALKRSEEQLIIYAAELERKVKNRTEALDKTIIELERLNRDLQEQILVRERAEEEAKKALERERELNDLKSKFVSIASHEFRTPLSTVLSSASLIGQYREKNDLEKMVKHIDRIKSSVNHLTNILNDLLSLGKLEEGRVDVSPEPTILSQFFNDISEDLKHTLKPGQILTIMVEGKEREILTDTRILRNIFFNLISNASKYSDAGKNIYIKTVYKRENVDIHVKDEGIGIPENEIKHLFERFFRASNVTNIQGTGLGLNIVKKYITLLKGNIHLSSEYGKGSTFTVALPYQTHFTV